MNTQPAPPLPADPAQVEEAAPPTGPECRSGPGPDPDLCRALQLSRASTLSLTRLQLALAGGDRSRAMEEIDRLHGLDAAIEDIAGRLHSDVGEDPEWTALTGTLRDQKMALAFERLALASGITGPDLASRPNWPASLRPLHHVPSAGAEDAADPPPAGVEWPPLPGVEPTEWNPLSARLIGLLLALAVTLALAAAAVTMTLV